MVRVFNTCKGYKAPAFMLVRLNVLVTLPVAATVRLLIVNSSSKAAVSVSSIVTVFEVELVITSAASVIDGPLVVDHLDWVSQKSLPVKVQLLVTAWAFTATRAKPIAMIVLIPMMSLFPTARCSLPSSCFRRLALPAEEPE